MTEAPFTHIVIQRISSGTESFVNVGTLLKESEIPQANLVALIGADYVAPLTQEDFEKYNAPAVVESVEPEVEAAPVPKPAAKKAPAKKAPAKKAATKTVKKSVAE